MPKVLTKQQVKQFHDEGYLSPIDVMSEHEAQGYRRQLEEIEHDYPDQINAQNRNNAHLVFPALDKLAHHPVIVDAVEDLIGPDISLWGSVLFIKEPQTSGFVSWHQDATYMRIEPHDFVTPWLALTPSNLGNGCMSMIPGSHKNHILKHYDTFGEDNILTRGQVVKEVDETSAVDLILLPGQMSLHHAEIIHGSQPNLSNDRRIGYALQAFMPPHTQQVLGDNYWLNIRGNNPRENNIPLQRPSSNMAPQAGESRKLVNDNWANILYHSAEKKRAF
jgi:non-heme Fe2+,alpha-ketoglutarate-dependent halogenase